MRDSPFDVTILQERVTAIGRALHPLLLFQMNSSKRVVVSTLTRNQDEFMLTLLPSRTLRASILALLLAPTTFAQEAPPEGVATSDWASIRAAYDAGRHEVLESEAGLSARNPGQGWQIGFDSRGFLVQPDASEWSWGLELMSYGFEDSELFVGEAACASAAGGRVAYAWDENLEEWYINDTRGLEHGFTVRERPASGTNERGELTFELLVRGSLTPCVGSDQRDASFLDAQGVTALTYNGLTVFDATGRTLPASFLVDEHRLTISVDERGATYPLTIDPIAQEAYLKASNTDAGDLFGQSVAISDDTAVVGAYGESSNAAGIDGNQADNSMADAGAAYVFVRTGTTWTQQAYLKASSTNAGDEFGRAVAISGDTVVIGAPEEDGNGEGVLGDDTNNSGSNSGAAYVFTRTGTVWAQQAYLKPTNNTNEDDFGFSVAISNDIVVVGAPKEDGAGSGIDPSPSNGLVNSGAAYLFTRTGTVWASDAYVKASNPGSFDLFGLSVSVSGETVLVGAPSEDSNAEGVNGDEANNSASGAGGSYVFVRNAGVWSQQAYLKASNTTAGDEFGASVAISGERVVIGARFEDSAATTVDGVKHNDSVSNSGAAYVFARAGTTWSQDAYLKSANSELDDEFGYSVAIDGDRVVVGAIGEDSATISDQFNNTASSSGAAYVFCWNGTTWNQESYVKVGQPDTLDQFGSGVAVSNNTAVIGAPGEASAAVGVNGNDIDNTEVAAGAATVFDLNASGSGGMQLEITQGAYLKASNTDTGDHFGFSVASFGDTIVVGAPRENSGATGVNGDQSPNSSPASGAVYVFRQSSGTWAQEAYLKASNSEGTDVFGYSVSIYDDTIVVGAALEDSSSTGTNADESDNSAARSGAAYVFARTGTNWAQEAYLKASNTDPDDEFGVSVSVSGDLIVVGARTEASVATGVNGDESDNSAVQSGAAYVFARSGTDWTQEAYLKASNSGAGDDFGRSVAISGDTIVVGAHTEDSNAPGVNGDGTDNSLSGAGAAYVFRRSGTNWIEEAYLKASNPDNGDLFGASVGVSEDTIVVGAIGERSNAVVVDGDQTNNSAGSAGAVYVFTRTGANWRQDAYLKAPNTGVNDSYGRSVAVSGDTIVVGATGEDSGATSVNGDQADNSASGAGAVYVLRRIRTNWSQEAYLKASNADGHDEFGHSVAVDGNTILVGTYFEESSATGANGDGSDNSSLEAGAAYVFLITPPPFPEFCNGDGGNQLGCTNCPCMNNAAPGSIGGCLNSAGTPAQLIASGDPSVSLPFGALTDLRFSLAGAPPSAFCILNSGNGVAPGGMANPCFGLNSGIQAMQFDGLRCAIMSTRRHGGRSANVNGEVGVTNSPWGGEGGPNVSIAQAGPGFVAGQTRFFQVINRDDPLASCMRGLNTSQAIEITFTP